MSSLRCGTHICWVYVPNTYSVRSEPTCRHLRVWRRTPQGEAPNWHHGIHVCIPVAARASSFDWARYIFLLDMLLPDTFVSVGRGCIASHIWKIYRRLDICLYRPRPRSGAHTWANKLHDHGYFWKANSDAFLADREIKRSSRVLCRLFPVLGFGSPLILSYASALAHFKTPGVTAAHVSSTAGEYINGGSVLVQHIY